MPNKDHELTNTVFVSFYRHNKRSKDQEKAVLEQGLPPMDDSPSEDPLPPPVPLTPSLLPAPVTLPRTNSPSPITQLDNLQLERSNPYNPDSKPYHRKRSNPCHILYLFFTFYPTNIRHPPQHPPLHRKFRTARNRIERRS